MTRRLIIRSEAERDLTDAAVWYDSRVPGFGLKLISEVHSAIGRALKNPESFTRVRRNPIVHRVLIRDSLIAFSSLFDLTRLLFLPCSTQHDTIEFGSSAQNRSNRI
jgi:hypothetical protein